MTPRGNGPALALAVGAIVLYATSLLLPFLCGTVRVIALPVARVFTLPAFIGYLFAERQHLLGGLLAVLTCTAPTLKHCLLLAPAPRLSARLRRRWAALDFVIASLIYLLLRLGLADAQARLRPRAGLVVFVAASALALVAALASRDDRYGDHA